MAARTREPRINRTYRLMRWSDPRFEEVYGRGMQLTEMRESKTRRKRFFNLVQLFTLSMGQEGDIAECGCWRGLSSYVMCNYLRGADPAFRGGGYHIFDSFEGLPEPTPEDGAPAVAEEPMRGRYAAALADVQKALADFPDVAYHPGWIPDSFAGLPERSYRFVHVDLDLYRSILDAIEYFFPRLSSRGILVCDDYASHKWPGARRAVDEFAAQQRLRILKLTTGQAVFVQPHSAA